MENAVAANILGTLGATPDAQTQSGSQHSQQTVHLTDTLHFYEQLIPQIIVNYRRHNTVGLQPSMMMLWAWAGVPLGVYNITEEYNVALRIQPQILTLLSLVTWAQCCYYDWKVSDSPTSSSTYSVVSLVDVHALHQHWSLTRCVAVVVPLAAFMAAVQVALIFALLAARAEAHLTWPATLMAALSAALLAAGVLRHYWDVYLHRSVRGISFIFVGIDAAGDLFSLLSVFFQPRLDVLGIVIYGTELVLWLGLFAAGGYFNLEPWVRTRFGSSGPVPPRVSLSDAPAHGGPDGHGNRGVDVVLHDMPSSTSVFRTASCDVPGQEGGARTRPGFTTVA
ncbi:uncharacterized protein PpBr36_09943 [Pyricularia pennisetigena]|uniref:uncharacterized protein n=1 Tax=Pyricularia pennisetigena TaxID=1578925 RepID=UPI00115496CF|nr:uncharacterized protein PpBr36_09943 [Pyricularia pennisetigena]TLS22361.1 hypothetical protein PpBr36_09943 [Pyricularia pennisetigena]